MKVSTNFNLLFKKPSVSRYENKKIFRKAALLFDFDLKKEFSEFSKTDIGLLKSQSFLKNNGRYILPEEIRIKIIQEEIGIDNIANEIMSNEIRSEFSETLLKVVNTTKINLKVQSDSELFYLTKVATLFPDKLNLDEIKIELQRRYYFAPFLKITENFAGRKKELEQVNDYVDWLPKKTFASKTIGFIRNIINWYEKPPLLIQGIGGIGKSTLISKFIIDHNREKEGISLPFIYIDFDLPGFSLTEPLSILLEGLRQLSIQYPHHQNIFAEISKNISDMINYRSNTKEDFIQASTESSRGLIYDSIDGLISKYNLELDKINTPILFVFDSFEEMQYRASRDEMNRFFSFVREISDKTPRFRPVFAGRSEISESIIDFKFDKIELTVFDKESANALLRNFGISDSNLSKKIYSNFGGNPLLLQLAADLIIKDKDAINELDHVIEKKHEYLVTRILDQIHDPDVRKIAVPGMLLRRITPQIIQDILAGPCKLGDIDEQTAEKIFAELCKEASVISKSYESNEIIFRQDLRIECEKLIWEKYPDEAQQIQQKAISFYKEFKSENDNYEAEYYYHLLKSGILPEELTRDVYNRIRPKLETSLPELPSKAQLFLKTLSGSQASEKILNQSEIMEWENYYLAQIQRGLNGESGFLKKLYKELNNRVERSNDIYSIFPIYEALLYQRLNRISQSNKVIDRAIDLINSVDDFSKIKTELMIIKIQNLEYQTNYEDALLTCRNNYIEVNDDSMAYLMKKNEFLKMRLAMRCGEENPVINEEILNYGSSVESDFIDTHWNYVFQNIEGYSFLNSSEFDTTYKNYKELLLTVSELDRYCWKSLGLNLKDIALSGLLDIVLKDFLYIMELRGDIENYRNIYK